MVRKFRSKKKFKQLYRKCQICGENDFDTLDVHRFKKEGKEGGKYTVGNCVVLCAKCHRKVHAGKIQLIGYFNSTKGELFHFIDEEGNERFN